MLMNSSHLLRQRKKISQKTNSCFRFFLLFASFLDSLLLNIIDKLAFAHEMHQYEEYTQNPERNVNCERNDISYIGDRRRLSVENRMQTENPSSNKEIEMSSSKICHQEFAIVVDEAEIEFSSK
mmetsp:Transcript_56239/g.64519  ORF Transcript_56239/g.64519 Transcript_56239/m.64519 type:complete len:124 (-) Transcript_56239:209-580(-)